MNVVIRPARLSDAQAVTAFGARVVPQHYAPILGADAAENQLRWWTLEHMTASIAAGRVHVGTSVGTVAAVCETGEFDGGQVVWKLYVESRARGRGIGVALLEQAIAALPGEPHDVLLEHFAGNTRAAAFYEREGFLVLRTEPAASGNPAAAVVWRHRAIPRARS